MIGFQEQMRRMYRYRGNMMFFKSHLDEVVEIAHISYKDVVKCYEEESDGVYHRNTIYEALTDFVSDGRQFVPAENGDDSERVYEKQKCRDNDMRRKVELNRWKKVEAKRCSSWFSRNNINMEKNHTEEELITLFRALLEMFKYDAERDRGLIPPFTYIQRGAKIMLYKSRSKYGIENDVTFDLKGIFPGSVNTNSFAWLTELDVRF